MEFLIYALCSASVGVALFKPTWEKWGFRLLVISFVLAAAVYLSAASGSFVPAINL